MYPSTFSRRTFSILPLALACLSLPAWGADGNTQSALDLILSNHIIALFAIVGLGMLLGKISVFGLSLGNSGVIFVALAFGAWGYAIPSEAGTFGLLLFVYCVGITAGPVFFRAFVQQGSNLAKLSVLLVVAGGATTYLCAKLVGIPADLAAGVFAGSMTSTPALAAAMDALPEGSRVSIGYGIAYPFGVVGVVLFVQMLPRFLHVDLDEEGHRLSSQSKQRPDIERALIEVCNPSVFGRKVTDVPFIEAARCQVSRVLQGEEVRPITPDTAFEEGMCVLAVGDADRLPDLVDFLGKRSSRRYFMDVERQRMRVVATSREVVGKTLRELNLLNHFGVTISRIERRDIGFVPRADTVITRADVMLSVGEPESLQAFALFAGHRARVLDETDLISLMFGLVAGMIVGMIPIGLKGTQSFTLGFSGGPLLVGLVLGHFGHIGQIRGHIPRAARNLMTEIGLVFFLAGAGTKAGAQFLAVLREYGAALPLMGVAVTLAPMAVGYAFARYALKLNILQSLGGVCGGMTSTPGLGIITSKTDSDIPATSYATAYPVALILMTLLAQLLVAALS